MNNKVKVILPSICFAVLSTTAFEKVVHAAENDTPTPEVFQISEDIQYVKVNKGSYLNLRSKASASSTSLAKLSNGTQVSVNSIENRWAKIQVNGQEGFVSVDFLTTTNPGTTTTPTPVSQPKPTLTTKYVKVNTGSYLNLRSKASTSGSIVAKLSNGEAVSVYSVENDWAKVKVNGREGFVSARFLTDAKPTSSGSSTVTPSTPVNKPQESVTKKYVKVSAGSYLNLREKASTSSNVIATLSNGTQVSVYSVEKGWAKVKANGKDGYVSVDFLIDLSTGTSPSAPTTPEAPPVVTTTIQYVNVGSNSHLNLRAKASTSGTILAKLNNGAELTVYSVANGWAKVKVDGKDGYVSIEFLSKTKPSSALPTPPIQEAVKKYVDVNPTSSLNMRKSPSTDSSIVVKLARGIEVTVLSEENGWAKIIAYGKEGYVSNDFLSSLNPKDDSTPAPTPEDNTNSPENPVDDETENSETEPNETQPNPEDGNTPIENGSEPEEEETPEEPVTLLKYVNVDPGSSLNMRTSPSTSTSVVRKLNAGTVVTVISEENGWAKIIANGETGFVSSKYLLEKVETPSNTTNRQITTVNKSYEISLEELTNIQMLASPQTDKKYSTYIREDALILNNLLNPTSATVKGNGWNVRGGAGTEHWIVGKINNGETLNILSKIKGSDGFDWYEVSYNKSWVNASPEDVKYYLDPTNFIDNPVTSFQFLKLSETTSLDQFEVNERILAGKGILAGHAATFITASERYGVNDMYLISHALLETGNGSSKLAQGVEMYGKTVYNMFGIGAYDGTAISSGANFAYNAGWFTPEAAIMGGAQFIANGYINSGQDTLYKMRWNPQSAVVSGSAKHQYATDIGWATKQVNQIYNLYNLLDKYKITLEIPSFKLK